MVDLLIFILVISWCGLAYLSLKRPGFALVLVYSFFMVEQIFAFRFPSFYLSNTKFVDLLTGLTVLGVVLLRGNIRQDRFPRTAYLGFSLIGMCAISMLWSVDPHTTSEKFNEVIPVVVLFMVVAPLCISSPNDLKDFLWGMIIFGGLACLIYALGEKSGRGLAFAAGRKSVELGPLAASQFAGNVVIATSFAFFGWKDSVTFRWVLVAIGLLALFDVAGTGSRGQLIALFPVLVFWLPIAYSPQQKPWKVIFALSFGLILSYAAYLFVEEFGFTDRWESQNIESGTEIRTELAGRLMRAFVDGGPLVWLIGLGSSASYSIAGFYCHIVPIEVLGELGLIGATIYLFYLHGVFSYGYLVTRNTSNISLRMTLAALIGMAIYDTLLSFKQGSLMGVSTLGYTQCAIVATYVFGRQPSPQQKRAHQPELQIGRSQR